MDRRAQILEVKRAEVESLRPEARRLRESALGRNDFRQFELAIQRGDGELGLIAEIKKASPSAGVIASDFDPLAIAESYQAAAAHAISVLTDRQFFQGGLDILTAVRRSVSLPVLRKDFIIDELQIYEASSAGADAILLIVAALEPERFIDLLDVADACQLDALVEVHTLDELELALDAEARIVGINNRDLTTFEVDLQTSVRLSEEVPEEVVLVSESGISDGSHTRLLIDCGVDAILVGESLMRSSDVGATINSLLDPPKPAQARVLDDSDPES